MYELRLIIVLTALFTASCGYKGDSEYLKNGTWSFVNKDIN